MSKPAFVLTPNEREIMDLLWREGKPLARSQIIELSPNRSWKEGSIHILLNKMLKKEALQVDGFVKTVKNYGRTFAPTVSPEEYQVMQFQQSQGYRTSKSEAIANFVTALIDEDLDEATLDQLQKIVQERKKGKKGKA